MNLTSSFPLIQHRQTQTIETRCFLQIMWVIIRATIKHRHLMLANPLTMFLYASMTCAQRYSSMKMHLIVLKLPRTITTTVAKVLNRKESVPPIPWRRMKGLIAVFLLFLPLAVIKTFIDRIIKRLQHFKRSLDAGLSASLLFPGESIEPFLCIAVHVRKRNTLVSGPIVSADYHSHSETTRRKHERRQQNDQVKSSRTAPSHVEEESQFVRPYFLIRPQSVILLPNETGKGLSSFVATGEFSRFQRSSNAASVVIHCRPLSGHTMILVFRKYSRQGVQHPTIARTSCTISTTSILDPWQCVIVGKSNALLWIDSDEKKPSLN